MSNKIRALGNSSTSLTLETIFDFSALEISVEILSLLLDRSRGFIQTFQISVRTKL